MYKLVGCVVIFGFALYGFKEWYKNAHRIEDKSSKN